MPVSLTRANLQPAWLFAAIAAVCTVTGWALVQHSKLAMLPVAILGLLALMVVFAELGLKALWLWPALGVAAAPISEHLGSKWVSFDRIWVIGMAVLLLTLPRARARTRASRQMMLVLTLLTIVLGVRSFATTASSLYPIRIWFDSLVIPLILFAVVRRVVSVDGRLAQKVALSLMAAGLLLALIGLAERATGFELATAAGSEVRFDELINTVRISGPYGVPETYGLVLLSCLAATMYWLTAWPRERWVRFAGVGIAALEVLAIFFTFFRVGWISAALIIVCAVGLRPRHYGRGFATVLILGLMALPLFLAFEQLPDVSTRINNTENIYTRLATYEQGWQIFESAPIFGVGAQSYNAVATPLPVVILHHAESVPFAHSSFFEVLAEYGIVGMVAFLTAGAGVWRLIRALNRTATIGEDAVLAGVLVSAALAYLIYSASLEMLPYSPSNAMFAILLGLAAGRLDFRAGTRARAAQGFERAQ